MTFPIAGVPAAAATDPAWGPAEARPEDLAEGLEGKEGQGRVPEGEPAAT